MLMGETARSLAFDDAAVEREKKVILSEGRVRDTYAQRNTMDRLKFLYPGARFHDRMPIGIPEAVAGAGSRALRAFWQRTYRPDNAALVVIGDVDPSEVEQKIMAHFAGWTEPPDG